MECMWFLTRSIFWEMELKWVFISPTTLAMRLTWDERLSSRIRMEMAMRARMMMPVRML